MNASDDVNDCSGSPATHPIFRLFSEVWFVLVLVVLFSSLCWWFKRRNVLYLKRRSFSLILFLALSPIFNILAGAIPRIFPNFDHGVPGCFVSNFCFFLVVPIAVNTQVIRLELFRRRTVYNRKVAEALHSNTNDEISSETLTKLRGYKYRASGKFGIHLACLNTFLCCLASGVYGLIKCPIFFDGNCNTADVSDYGTGLLFSFLGIAIIFHCYVRKHTAGEPDPFRILHEIFRGYLVPGVLCGLSFILGIINPGNIVSTSPQKWSWGALADVGVLFFFVYAVPWQVYLSYSFSKRTKMTGEIHNIKLQEVLNSSTGYMLFEQHLVNEFSPENLYYWKAVEEWKDKFDNRTASLRRMEAINIYSRYLKPNTLFEVNIEDDENKSNVEDIINGDKALEKDTFDTLQSEIFNLMSSDSFERFKKDPLFTEYIGTNKQHSSISSPTIKRQRSGKSIV